MASLKEFNVVHIKEAQERKRLMDKAYMEFEVYIHELSRGLFPDGHRMRAYSISSLYQSMSLFTGCAGQSPVAQIQRPKRWWRKKIEPIGKIR